MIRRNITSNCSVIRRMRLKRANRIVAALIGGDPTAVPLVHPLGCPGSVHRKAEPKRRIVELRGPRD